MPGAGGAGEEQLPEADLSPPRDKAQPTGGKGRESTFQAEVT